MGTYAFFLPPFFPFEILLFFPTAILQYSTPAAAAASPLLHLLLLTAFTANPSSALTVLVLVPLSII